MRPFAQHLLLLFLTTALLLPNEGMSDWSIVDQSPAQNPQSPLIHERKVVTKVRESGFFSPRTIDLIWFDGDHYTFQVIDNRGGSSPRYPSLAAAMIDNDCLAGCNGGFFHPDFSPSGLMIASGETFGRFGEGALLSGVLLSSGKNNPYLLRRAEYNAATYKAKNLIQSGPFLVDRGATVRGLSPENSRRRTFVLHDGGRWFALGLSGSFTLAELGTVLAQADFSPSRPIHRALNLDGGTSSGLYLPRGSKGAAINDEPIKTVRNFVGIVPKTK